VGDRARRRLSPTAPRPAWGSGTSLFIFAIAFRLLSIVESTRHRPTEYLAGILAFLALPDDAPWREEWPALLEYEKAWRGESEIRERVATGSRRSGADVRAVGAGSAGSGRIWRNGSTWLIPHAVVAEAVPVLGVFRHRRNAAGRCHAAGPCARRERFACARPRPPRCRIPEFEAIAKTVEEPFRAGWLILDQPPADLSQEP
jgi:hypothetical protein